MNNARNLAFFPAWSAWPWPDIASAKTPLADRARRLLLGGWIPGASASPTGRVGLFPSPTKNPALGRDSCARSRGLIIPFEEETK